MTRRRSGPGGRTARSTATPGRRSPRPATSTAHATALDAVAAALIGIRGASHRRRCRCGMRSRRRIQRPGGGAGGRPARRGRPRPRGPDRHGRTDGRHRRRRSRRWRRRWPQRTRPAPQRRLQLALAGTGSGSSHPGDARRATDVTSRMAATMAYDEKAASGPLRPAPVRVPTPGPATCSINFRSATVCSGSAGARNQRQNGLQRRPRHLGQAGRRGLRTRRTSSSSPGLARQEESGDAVDTTTSSVTTTAWPRSSRRVRCTSRGGGPPPGIARGHRCAGAALERLHGRTARMALSVNSRVTSSSSNSFWYCLYEGVARDREDLHQRVDVEFLTVATIGSRPMNSGIRPNLVRSSGRTWASRSSESRSSAPLTSAVKPRVFLPTRLLDDVLQTGESTADDEQDVRRVDLGRTPGGRFRPPCGGTERWCPR